MGIPDIVEKGLEYLVNLLVRCSICPEHVTYIAHGPAQGPPLYAQCLSIAARKKNIIMSGMNKAFIFLHPSGSLISSFDYCSEGPEQGRS